MDKTGEIKICAYFCKWNGNGLYGVEMEVKFLFFLVIYTFEQGQWVTCSQN